jgi:predicted ATP-dependent endonuclease of OLD family
MSKIGFRNFRRFTDFKPIEFKAVTFLVGRNNSGKSTLVKALLLIIDYLKTDNLKTLSFNQNNVEDVNIVTFKRALNKRAKLNKEEFIELLLEIDGLRFTLLLTGKDDNTEVDVINLIIDDVIAGFSFVIKPQENSITISTNSLGYEVIPENEENLLIELEDKKADLENTLRNIKQKSSPEYIQLNSELKQLKNKISELRKTIKSLLKGGQFSLHSHFTSTTLKDVLKEMLDEHSAEYEIQYHDIQRGKKSKKIFESLKSFKDNKFKIEKSISTILEFQMQIETIYLGATLNKQSALFAIRDKRNPLSQAIHEYKQLGIDKDMGSDAYKFVRDWMKKSEFEIGDSFDIEMHAGEAYEVVVNSFGLQIPLADKGMGSIQAMLLILRLAVVIFKKQSFDRLNNIIKPEAGKPLIVIIEEPELNLHPALQSKLADLFHDVYDKFKIRLVIETHSEYLIRKTQLIVKQKEYEVEPNDNPFTVIYFDKELNQWLMNYRADGVFKEDFGPGFFDVSSQQAITLFKRKENG